MGNINFDSQFFYHTIHGKTGSGLKNYIFGFFNYRYDNGYRNFNNKIVNQLILPVVSKSYISGIKCKNIYKFTEFCISSFNHFTCNFSRPSLHGQDFHDRRILAEAIPLNPLKEHFVTAKLRFIGFT
jgi:hypothetical protein